MKIITALVLGAGLLLSLPSHADNGGVLLGAGIGGAVGAVVGSQIGGHDGAILGGALGAATGAAITYDDYGRPVRYVERYPRHDYYRGPVNYIYVDEGRGHHPHHRRHHHYHRHDRGYHDGYRDSRTIVIVR